MFYLVLHLCCFIISIFVVIQKQDQQYLPTFWLTLVTQMQVQCFYKHSSYSRKFFLRYIGINNISACFVLEQQPVAVIAACTFFVFLVPLFLRHQWEGGVSVFKTLRKLNFSQLAIICNQLKYHASWRMNGKWQWSQKTVKVLCIPTLATF